MDKYLHDFSAFKLTTSWFALLFLGLTVLLGGCSQLQLPGSLKSTCPQGTIDDGMSSSISAFFSLKNYNKISKITITVASVDLLIDDTWVSVPMSDSAMVFDGALALQNLLGRISIQDAKLCKGARLKLGDIEIIDAGVVHKVSLARSDSSVTFANPGALFDGSSSVVLFECDVEKLLMASQTGEPFIAIRLGDSERIAANLVFAACPDLNTIFVIRADIMQIVGAIGVAGRPTRIVADLKHNRLVIWSPVGSKLTTIDLANNHLLSETTVPFGSEPRFLAIDGVTQDFYLLDSNGYLARVDLLTGNVLDRTRICNRANYLYMVKGIEKLAVSSSVDQSIYIVDKSTLTVDSSVMLGSQPSGIYDTDNKLYIAEPSVDSVTIYDLNERKIVKTIHVGYEPARFTSQNNQVYLSNSLDGSVSVIQSEQFNVIKDIFVGGVAKEIAVSQNQNAIYVTTEDNCKGGISIIDTTSNQILGRIELGGVAQSIAVVN